MKGMKRLVISVIIMMLPICCIYGYTVDFSQTEFSFYKTNSFDRIRALKFAFHGAQGTPELPVIFQRYIISPTMNAESLINVSYNLIALGGTYQIYPNQKSVVIGDTSPWVAPDTAIYHHDNLYPGKVVKIVSQGVFDGARIVTLAVQPIQYLPLSKKLIIAHNISFEFGLSSTNLPTLRPIRRGVNEQILYNAFLKNIVNNADEIMSYYQPPELVEEGGLLSIPPPQYAPAVIITPMQFWSAFTPYRDWMIDQGIQTVMVDPQSIFSAYSGCDNAEKVRNYIKYCYQNYGGTYFILGGDDDLVPVRWCCEYVGDEDTIIPTDLYYSDLSGDWDADHDGKWGEWEDAADQFPEVFIGRITAYNSQEVQNWVTKVLNYEKTPGVIFDKAVWIYTSNVGVGSAPSAFPTHFTHLYAPDYWADAALTFLSQGNGIININCHGNAGDYYTRYGEAKHWSWRDQAPDSYNAGLNWLTNNNKYFIGYAISCYIGAYDSLAHPIYYEYGTDTCIADAYVDAYLYNHQGSIGPFGASAFLANTRNGIPGNSHNLQYAFWIRIMNPCFYPEPANTRIGVAEAYSKCDGLINWGDVYDRYICYAHTLFGSPYTEIWTKTPGNLAVTHPTQIQVNVPIPFTVTVKKSSFPQTPLQYAKVCLNKPGDIYQVGSTNSNGQVTFTVSPTSTGTLKVTVTRLHNADNNYNQYRPSQSTCQVVGGGGGQSSGEEVIKPSSLYLADVPILAQQGFTLDYGIPITGEIIVSMYDETGALVKTIIKAKKQAGYHKQIISTDNLANGIYFVVLEQNQQSISKKLLIIN